MKALFWVGTSLDDLRLFPPDARVEAGMELRRVQDGVAPRDWRPMPIAGAGVREIRISALDGAYRVLYVVESATEVYVLHAFRKKTQKTSRKDIDIAISRYKQIP